MKIYEKPMAKIVVFRAEETMLTTSQLNYNIMNLNFYDDESAEYNIFDI